MYIIMLSKYDEDIMVLYREDEKLKYKGDCGMVQGMMY